MAPTYSESARLKYSLVQLTYISAAWNWFLILADKAAEPVLYAFVKLLLIVHFPPQWDGLLSVGSILLTLLQILPASFLGFTLMRRCLAQFTPCDPPQLMEHGSCGGSAKVGQG